VVLCLLYKLTHIDIQLNLLVKSGSQSILGSVVGTGLGLLISGNIGPDHHLLVLAFLACSGLHLTATYFSLANVIINNLTTAKLDLLLKQYFKSLVADKQKDNDDWQGLGNGGGGGGGVSNGFMSPNMMLACERLLVVPPTSLPSMRIGTDLDKAIPTGLLMEVRQSGAWDL
jgi:hypothetical protein